MRRDPFAFHIWLPWVAVLCFSLPCWTTASISAEVSDLQPRVCHPGQSVQIALTGKGFDSSLRIALSRKDWNVELESIASEQAIVRLTPPDHPELGPLGVWTVCGDSPPQTWIVMVDDLPAVARSNDNQTAQSAQRIPNLSTVSGVSRGAESDYYRFEADSGQRIAFEVLTQCLNSPMDPVVRLLDATGQQLVLVDDDSVGPEVRFSHTFPAAGEYLLEIRDNQYAAGGQYHLRVGDFPVLASATPAAIRRGESAKVAWQTLDGSEAEPSEVRVPADCLDHTILVASKQPGGSSSSWMRIGITDFPIPMLSRETHAPDQTSVAPSASPRVTIPFCVTGALDESGEHRRIEFIGLKGQTVRFASRTRSLGSPALLQMQLFRLDGLDGSTQVDSGHVDSGLSKVAGTAVSDMDEWSFDYQFPDDNLYRLEINDLLSRSGIGFGYMIEAHVLPAFSLAIKGDASTPSQYVVGSGRGARAMDLSIQRHGYDGAIDLQLVGDSCGLALLNPRIPASASEARIFVVAGEEWTPERLSTLRLVGRASEHPHIQSTTSNVNIQRLQQPNVPFPLAWNDGLFVFAGAIAANPLFTLEAEPTVSLARRIPQQSVSLRLQRLVEEFKGEVTLLPQRLPDGWTAVFKTEKDICTVNLNLESSVESASVNDSPAAEQKSLDLLAYAEQNHRGYMESFDFPIDWFDPVKVTLQSSKTVLAGSKLPVSIHIVRTRTNEPVTITWRDVPEGLELPEPIAMSADQNSAEVEWSIPTSLTGSELQIGIEASSQYQGQPCSAYAQLPPVQVIPLPNRIEVFPSEIALESQKSCRQLVITGFDAKESTRDWTEGASILSLDTDIAEVRGSVVYPKSDGETTIEVKIGDLRLSVPVRVSGQQSPANILFESEVLAALSKQGCNSGACHGSPSGKGMFRLSLRAFDRQLDEYTLIREDFGRRINPVDPEQSLLLLKPLMKTTHGGGKQMRTDDAAYRILTQWIHEGGRADPDDTPRCVRVEVFPNSKRTLPLAGGKQQISVTAHFADHSSRDITELACYESSNMQVATIDARGRVQAVAQGEAVILVRFLEHIETVPLTFIDTDADFQWQAPEPLNYVDHWVYEKLRQMQFLPAETCNDAEFLRRVYLDVIGILPSVDESKAFLTDDSTHKRAQLIDQLLDREEHARFWALKWGDLLRMTGKLVGDAGVHKYHRWLEEALRKDMPYDQFARELVTASGSTLSNPPANLYRVATDMNECAEAISQIFMGARLQCAKCHNHPFERWTQDNYYGLAAFFHRVQRRQTQRPGEMFIWTSDSGEVTQPRTGQQVAPWLPTLGDQPTTDSGDRRVAFAEWLTAQDNPYFARIGANRIWSHLFARGIVDPVDDFRDSNPPTNAGLLDALAGDFQQNGYSTRHLIRTILNSRTYQANSQPHPQSRSDEFYFSHQIPRLLGGEQLLDALNHVTGVSQQFGFLPAGLKATQLPAPDLVKVDFLKVFGQPERNTVCACERSDDSNLAMAIELLNGPLIHERLKDANNRIHRAIAAGTPSDEILNDLYLAALCRLPNEAERTAAVTHLQQRQDIAAGWEDICWALLNTDEFLFQH